VALLAAEMPNTIKSIMIAPLPAFIKFFMFLLILLLGNRNLHAMP
jgi:hypothetical protein